MNSRFLDPVGLLLAMSGRLAPIPLAQIDCDELTAFVLTLAFFLDMPAEVVTVAADPTRPDQFTHVYLRLQHKPGDMIPFDLTAGPYPGCEPLHVYRRRIWSVGTPIDLSDCPEPDRAAAQAVSAVIASARASAAHPTFRLFLKHLAQLFLGALCGLIRKEQERRSETGNECGGILGEGQGELFFRDLSEADLQSLAAYFVHCQTGLEDDQVELLKLIETGPEFDIPELTPFQVTEWGRFILDDFLARLSGPGGERDAPQTQS